MESADNASTAPDDLADRAILSTIENCVWALAGRPARLLLVTPLSAALVAKSDGVLASALVLTPGSIAGTARCPVPALSLPSLSLEAQSGFDVIVLDRFAAGQGQAPWLKAIGIADWSRVRDMRSRLKPGGHLIVLLAAGRTGALQRALLSAGFSNIEGYGLLPRPSATCHLVSRNARAIRTFMLRAHGFSSDLPRNPLQWPKWIAVYMGADRWSIDWYVFHAQR